MASLFDMQRAGFVGSTDLPTNISTEFGPARAGRGNTLYVTGQTKTNRGSVLGARTSSGGGGGGGNISTGEAPLLPEPSRPDTSEYDRAYNEALNALGQAEGAAQSAYEASRSEIGTGATKLKGQVEQARTQQLGVLGQQETSAGKITQSAIDEARRGFSELQQGLLARYGTGTSTGQAATSILGGETLRNIGRARSGLQDAINQINQKREEVDQISNNQLLEIEQDSQTKLLSAKAELDRNLADIGRQRGELAGRKAEVLNAVMQNYRNRVADIQAENVRFKQQIYLSNQEYQQRLAAAANRASNQIGALEESFTLGRSRFIPLSQFGEQAPQGVETRGPFAVFTDISDEENIVRPESDLQNRGLQAIQ